jgi:hypothetical protein
MTQANQIDPTAIVNRSRLRSATDDPPSELDTPPPNMSDRPPPRPLCSSTSSTNKQLVITSKAVKTTVTRTAYVTITDSPNRPTDRSAPADLTQIPCGQRVGMS